MGALQQRCYKGTITYTPYLHTFCFGVRPNYDWTSIPETQVVPYQRPKELCLYSVSNIITMPDCYGTKTQIGFLACTKFCMFAHCGPTHVPKAIKQNP